MAKLGRQLAGWPSCVPETVNHPRRVHTLQSIISQRDDILLAPWHLDVTTWPVFIHGLQVRIMNLIFYESFLKVGVPASHSLSSSASWVQMTTGLREWLSHMTKGAWIPVLRKADFPWLLYKWEIKSYYLILKSTYFSSYHYFNILPENISTTWPL